MARTPKPVAGAKAPYPKAGGKRKTATKPKVAPAKATQKAPGGSKPKKTTKTSKVKKAPTAVLKTAEGLEAGFLREKPSNPVGRPSKYDPAYCDMVVEWGRVGKSREWIGATLMVLPETLANWSKEHPEFFAAITLAKQLEMLWWEDFGQQHLLTTSFSASGWSRSMAARFPTKWRENKGVALSGDPEGTPVKHEVGLRWMTPEEAKARGWA